MVRDERRHNESPTRGPRLGWRFWISQGLIFEGIWRGPGDAVQTLVALLLEEVALGGPVVIFGHRAQAQQVFDAIFGPAHAREFAAVFDQVAAGAFDDA